MAYTGPERKAMRAQGFDYREPGPYYVTICTEYRVHRFGVVIDGVMRLNEPGEMVHATWNAIAHAFPGVTLDAFVVMPNHVHGLLTLLVPDGPTLDGCASLSDVVGWFKTETTNRYIRGVKRLGWEPFEGKLWQRGFHDEIVRTERGVERVRRYIAANPADWPEDPEREPIGSRKPIV